MATGDTIVSYLVHIIRILMWSIKEKQKYKLRANKVVFGAVLENISIMILGNHTWATPNSAIPKSVVLTADE